MQDIRPHSDDEADGIESMMLQQPPEYALSLAANNQTSFQASTPNDTEGVKGRVTDDFMESSSS